MMPMSSARLLRYARNDSVGVVIRGRLPGFAINKLGPFPYYPNEPEHWAEGLFPGLGVRVDQVAGLVLRRCEDRDRRGFLELLEVVFLDVVILHPDRAP